MHLNLLILINVKKKTFTNHRLELNMNTLNVTQRGVNCSHTVIRHIPPNGVLHELL